MQRIPELHRLSHDHHRALVLARRCRMATTPSLADEAWASVRDAFPAELEPHFLVEETVLMPALEAAGRRDMVERLREDHAALRSAASVATAGPAHAMAFGERLEAHVRYEEREVFEWAQANLDASVLGAIAEASAAVPAPSCRIEVASPSRRG